MRTRKMTHALLFSALLPHLEMEERSSLDWGEKFLDSTSRRQLREQFEYQGSNLPIGRSDFDLARHRRRSTRFDSVQDDPGMSWG
jgi:hypothetical protein